MSTHQLRFTLNGQSTEVSVPAHRRLIDVIREEAPLPGLTTGDLVVMHPVGAYNVTQSMQFITYRPAVVMIDEDRKVHVIRRRENLDYVQELEQVPAHLADGAEENR